MKCTLNFSFKLIFSGFFVFINCFLVLLTRRLRRVYINGFFRNNGLSLRWTKREGRILCPVISVAIIQNCVAVLVSDYTGGDLGGGCTGGAPPPPRVDLRFSNKTTWFIGVEVEQHPPLTPSFEGRQRAIQVKPNGQTLLFVWLCSCGWCNSRVRKV